MGVEVGGARGEQAGRSGTGGSPADSAKTESEPFPLAIPKSMDYVCKLEGIQTREGSKSKAGNELKINGDKCIQCKRCVRGCPCNNIDDSVFPYVFKTQDCEYCMFCEGICPTGAVEYNFEAAKAAMSRGASGSSPAPNAARKGGSMSLQLDLAEAGGRFRRLLKEEDVGDKTWEQVTIHPRHKELP
jgi:ferredoxin